MVVLSRSHPKLNGKIADVKDYSGFVPGPNGGDFLPSWFIQIGLIQGICAEKCLMRIDDPDIQDQLEEESRKTKLDKYKEKVYANIHRSDTPGI